MKKSAYLSVCLLGLVMISAILAASALWADEKGKAQTLCPIMGGPIDKTAYVDYEGKRVYFCCNGCKSEFLKDPKKYIQKMESQGIVLEKVPEGKKDSSNHEQGLPGEARRGCGHHGCEHTGCGTHS